MLLSFPTNADTLFWIHEMFGLPFVKFKLDWCNFVEFSFIYGFTLVENSVDHRNFFSFCDPFCVLYYPWLITALQLILLLLFQVTGSKAAFGLDYLGCYSSHICRLVGAHLMGDYTSTASCNYLNCLNYLLHLIWGRITEYRP